tara:strand:+ start:1029 stop:1226 length:198 start_codon:yes stop_codon:yes gene_type:complete
MAKSGASKGAKKTDKTGDVNVASANFFGVPKNVRDAAKRQYSGKDYTIEDKQTIINHYKNKKGKA